VNRYSLLAWGLAAVALGVVLLLFFTPLSCFGEPNDEVTQPETSTPDPVEPVEPTTPEETTEATLPDSGGPR
jgi:hypothetical protein